MTDPEAEGRPHCATCGVDMWLTRVLAGAGPSGHAFVFECKVCGERVTMAADHAPGPGLDDGL